MAFSGLASYPFRDGGVERIVNDSRLDFEERAWETARAVSGVVLDDMNGSAAYRLYVLKNTVVNILEAVKEEHLPCLC